MRDRFLHSLTRCGTSSLGEVDVPGRLDAGPDVPGPNQTHPTASKPPQAPLTLAVLACGPVKLNLLDHM